MKQVIFLSYFLLYFSYAHAQGWKTYPYSPEGSLISFPYDEGQHPEEAIEWWYTAGHLTGSSSGTQYSYMLSYFYYPAYGFDGFRILNLSNDDTGAFFDETVAVNYKVMAEDSLNIVAMTTGGITESWANKTEIDDSMVPFEYNLSAEGVHGAISLEYISEKPPLILGDDGYFEQGQNSYTYYFSLTKNTVQGTLSIAGTTEDVMGTAWIDRQYGSFNPLTEEDYEWFFIQLSNDMDFNIYNLFTSDRLLPDTATYKHMSVYVDSLTQYTTHDFDVERLSFQYMADSVRCYAREWRLSSPQNNVELVISTHHNNSEVELPFRFFEGATTITGTVNGIPVTGKGFAELLHSYEKPEISVSYPAPESWTSSRPISWEITNPDDGRPLYYDLAYSIDDKNTFVTIAQELSVPFFYWTDPPIPDGSNCWFKVIAYSLDSTLANLDISSAPSVYDPNLTAISKTSDDERQKNSIKIYPNPADDWLLLDLDNEFEYVNYRILDISGKVMMDERITHPQGIQLNLESIPPGLYIIGLFTGDDAILKKFLIR